jgi:hypothetical protein
MAPLLRRPAGRAYLRRSVGHDLEPGTRPWLIALCEAELRWAVHDWRQLNPDADDGYGRAFGEPAPEACRLPHERAATEILNLNGKRAAWQAARDNASPQDAAYIARLEHDLVAIHRQLARAVARYHTLRAIADWRETDVKAAA